MTPREPSQEVFRDLIEEHRDTYSVSYQPADARSPIAILSLFFGDSSSKNVPLISKAMEAEMEAWLERFPVPIKVSTFDVRKRLIRISPNGGESILMGYVRLFDSAIVRRWGTIKEEEFPADTLDPEHLASAYQSISFRVREEERAIERLAFRAKVKGLSFALLLVLIVPALLQAVIRWGQELALPLMAASAVAGLYKGSGSLGWRKPSRREQKKAELMYRKEHYFYHCESNPSSFARLEQANLKREVTRENKEAKRLVEKLAARKKQKPRQNWIFLPRFLRARS